MADLAPRKPEPQSFVLPDPTTLQNPEPNVLLGHSRGLTTDPRVCPV